MFVDLVILWPAGHYEVFMKHLTALWLGCGMGSTLGFILKLTQASKLRLYLSEGFTFVPPSC